ncbi:MAG TPA: L-threonylcarbamoyladenylate synthase [Thermoanaerobaculia bacterium]|nr:L-threonylcarbamoyladenylate synthase [Thermoanaerobaculia bacterium]
MSRKVTLFHFGDPLPPLRDLLARGGIVAFPTESSYGLGVDPWNAAGVEAIYRIKEREAGKPLPVVVAGRDQLAGLGIDPDLNIVKRLFALWPAPLTAVLPVARPLPASAGTRTLAVRVPDHEPLRELLAALGHGLTATSANRGGEAPIVDPAALADLLAGEDAMVVDGGVLPGGPPSTLVAIEGDRVVVLRSGRFPAERLEEDLRPTEEEG